MLASFILISMVFFYLDIFGDNFLLQYIINSFCFPIVVVLKTYFDFALGIIQTFVFVILSINYWYFAKKGQ
jgi:F0F1-type ATP synthase membrane subunit a